MRTPAQGSQAAAGRQGRRKGAVLWQSRAVRPHDGPPSRYFFGTKAHHLGRLVALGLPVPEFIALAAYAEPPLEDLAAALEHTLGTTTGKHGRWALAIRSSAVNEDLPEASQAGSFFTRLGHFDSIAAVWHAIKTVRASAAPGQPMGVVVQRLLDPQLAGVAFSAHPLTFGRDRWALSWVTGRGDRLVSGAEMAHTLLVDRSGTVAPPSWPGTPDQLRQLLGALELVEGDLGMPADVEWAIAGGDLYMLQARPVVLPRAGMYDLATVDTFMRLPPVVTAHPKLALRRAAHELGVAMSRARLELRSATEPPAAFEFAATDLAVGLSVVLVHPPHVKSKVIREFAPPAGSSVEFFTRECRRYAVRRYPSFDNIADTVDTVLATGLEDSWVAAAIIQEVYNPTATGIMRRVNDGILLEVARGHFVPKGVVATSSFALDKSLEVRASVRRPQEAVYHFIDGHVVVESPVEQQLDLTNDEIRAAAEQLSPVLDKYSGTALEFGVLRRSHGVKAYVIDIAESDKAALHTTVDALASGVISPGRAQGRIVAVPDAPHQELDGHLLEQFRPTDEIAGTVFLARRASVDLLPLIYRCGSGAGFVFAQASLLAHVPVVLRERAVPAVVVGEDAYTSLLEANCLAVDATTPDLAAEDRVVVLDAG